MVQRQTWSEYKKGRVDHTDNASVYEITRQLMRLGDHLRAHRESRGLTMDELARKLETHYEMIEQIELGSLDVPVGTLLRAAHQLDMKLSLLHD